jgi:hypothetical protein
MVEKVMVQYLQSLYRKSEQKRQFLCSVKKNTFLLMTNWAFNLGFDHQKIPILFSWILMDVISVL